MLTVVKLAAGGELKRSDVRAARRLAAVPKSILPALAANVDAGRGRGRTGGKRPVGLILLPLVH